MKKVGKIFIKVLGWMLVAVLLFVAGTSIYNRVKSVDELNWVMEQGYYNPVSVGDHSLNVYRAGNEDGEHTFVTLSGWSDGEAFISWRPLTSQFEEDNEFIFIDRPGYGLSDDVSDDITVEYVVEDYRAALRNSGEEGPYILLAHSMGSLYTAYWVSTYPDEIEGVIIMDGSVPVSAEQAEEMLKAYSTGERILRFLVARMPYYVTRTGLGRIFPLADYSELFNNFTSEQQESAVILLNRTMASHACYEEALSFVDEEQTIWTYEHMTANDIPKVYIAASDYEDALRYAELLGNTIVYDLPGAHEIYLDRTEECVQIISDFLADLDT